MQKPTRLITAVAVLLAAFALLLFGLVWMHMRPDEYLAYPMTAGSLYETLWYQARQDVHAPVWYITIWVWRRLVGDTEFALRYQGVLYAMLTLAVVYRIAQASVRSQDAGRFAVLVVAANAYFFIYTTEIRPYATVMLVGAVSMWLFWRVMQQPNPRRAVVYGVSLAVLGYTHYFAAFLVLIQGIYALLRRPPRRTWAMLALAVGVGGVMWLPWLPTFWYQVGLLRQITGALGTPATATETSWAEIVRLMTLASNGVIWLWGGVLLLGLFTVKQRWGYVLLLLWGLGVPAANLTANLFAYVYTPRYIAYAALGMGAAAGVALAGLRYRALRWGALAAFVAVNVWLIPTQMAEDRVPYRDIFRQVNALSQPGDVVWFHTANITEPMVGWHIEAYLADELQQQTVASLDEAQQARRVWFVTGALFDEDVQADFRALERTYPLLHVIGECRRWCFVAQLLETAPNTAPPHTFTSPRNADALPLYGVDVDSISRDEVAVRLWWMPDAALRQDYSMSLRLTDTTGAIIAQQDGPPQERDGATVQTSTLEPGRMTADWRTLPLPPGVPPGDYALTIVVYHPVDGYNLPTNGQEQVTLAAITLP